jgi:glyoxylase-like metal-dependent hydrolase (beta-lactamase superfamily II)
MGRFAHIKDVILTYWVAGRLGKPKKHIWYPARLKPDDLLQDEQKLPGFEEWECLFTPGHTDHDVSLWHAGSRKLYVADLVVKVKGDLVPPYPVCHPNQYRRSLHRVSSLDNPQMLFAHVPEQALAASDFERLIAIAPRRPKNMWLSTKSRIKHVFGKR